jgi:EmrB/QacA subfamily drug resistance transporter
VTLPQRGALAAATIGSATVFLDTTVVNVALPQIGATLPSAAIGALEGQVYVVAGYMATLAAFLLVAGELADRFGRRRVFLAGLAGFGIASLACGLSPSLDVLAFARLLQGVAGALLVPGSLAIIAELFTGPARARAYGVWAAATSAVVVIGPPLGGVLVEAFGWRSIFLVNGPLVGAGLVLAVRHVPELRRPELAVAFDLLGAVVGVIAVGGLAFGAIRGQQVAWAEPGPLVALGLGAAAVVAFPVLMARRRDPLVPPSLFRNRAFSAINLSTLLIYAGLYVLLYMQNLFLQGVLGYSPLGAALITLPSGLALVLLSTWAGSLAGRIGARRLLAGGPLLMALGAGWWLRVPPTSAPWLARADDLGSLVPPIDALTDPLPATIIFGIGSALMVAPLTSTLMSSVPVERAGLASALNNALSRVGQPLASAAIFVVITDRFYASLASRVPGLDAGSAGLRDAVQPLNAPGSAVDPVLAQAARLASGEAFGVAMVVVAGLFLGGAAVNWIGLGRTGPPDPGERPHPTRARDVTRGPERAAGS